MIADSSIRPDKLLLRARHGDAEAVGQLLACYADYLRLLAVTQLDGKLRQRVSPSDVVQETCCEAHRDFAQFRGETEREFTAWLRQILIHTLARLVERHVLAGKRDVRRELSLERLRNSVDRSTARLGALLAGAEATPSQVAVERERGVHLANCIAQLPDDYQQVVMLRNFQGLPFKAVAEQMGRTSGAVRMLWLRALDQLRTLLDESDLP